MTLFSFGWVFYIHTVGMSRRGQSRLGIYVLDQSPDLVRFVSRFLANDADQGRKIAWCAYAEVMYGLHHRKTGSVATRSLDTVIYLTNMLDQVLVWYELAMNLWQKGQLSPHPEYNSVGPEVNQATWWQEFRMWSQNQIQVWRQVIQLCVEMFEVILQSCQDLPFQSQRMPLVSTPLDANTIDCLGHVHHAFQQTLFSNRVLFQTMVETKQIPPLSVLSQHIQADIQLWMHIDTIRCGNILEPWDFAETFEAEPVQVTESKISAQPVTHVPPLVFFPPAAEKAPTSLAAPAASGTGFREQSRVAHQRISSASKGPQRSGIPVFEPLAPLAPTVTAKAPAKPATKTAIKRPFGANSAWD